MTAPPEKNYGFSSILLVCRKTLVSSDPASCNTRNGEPKNVQLKTDIRVEALITAFWLFSKPRDIRDFFGDPVDIHYPFM